MVKFSIRRFPHLFREDLLYLLGSKDILGTAEVTYRLYLFILLDHCIKFGSAERGKTCGHSLGGTGA